MVKWSVGEQEREMKTVVVGLENKNTPMSYVAYQPSIAKLLGVASRYCSGA